MGNDIWNGARAGIASGDLFVTGDNPHLPADANNATYSWGAVTNMCAPNHNKSTILYLQYNDPISKLIFLIL